MYLRISLQSKTSDIRWIPTDKGIKGKHPVRIGTQQWLNRFLTFLWTL